MRLYRSTFTLRSASASEWQADTLFGHLCWSLVRREGADFLTDLFLAEYQAGSPPVLLSDGFPAGYLPRPRLAIPGVTAEHLSKTGRVLAYRETKDALKARWLRVDDFLRVREGEAVAPGRQPETAERTVSKNRIDRQTNTTGGDGGALFDFTELCLSEVDVYWRVADGYLSIVEEFLDDLKQTGYGKRKSVGYGEIASCTFALCEFFPEVAGANGFVTLSRFVPARTDPTAGAWTTVVKYGKLGEEAAAGPQPFKRPLIQFGAGSCFYDAEERDWYGRLVSGIAADPGVVQYGYGLPIRLRLPSGERT